jgi:CubicO group peptidase (beta-lactamase class C family)
MEKELKKLLATGIKEGVFPCAAAGIATGLGKERKKFITYCGNAATYPEKRRLKKNNYFDLASLTKPFATTMAILCLLKEKKIYLDETIPSFFENKIRGEKKNIKLRHLLSHGSGLPAHREYFKILHETDPGKNIFVEDLILQERLAYAPGTTSLYSDLGFMLLGRIVEIKTGCSLDHYVEERVLQPLRLADKIFYNPLSAAKKGLNNNNFAATENCSWRKKILCGEVHDDNCYVMGGVAGHSGLFGNIAGVTEYAGLILDMWKGAANHPNIKKEDLAHFLVRQEKTAGSNWTLGFDTPAANNSSSGRYLSPKSVGHLGFTGTSFWIDPEKDVVIVLLTNRVHPDRKNIKIRRFRPYFHDRVMEKLFPRTR